MICERCHRESISIKPLKFAPKAFRQHVGYLKFCNECYWKKKASDAGIVLGIIAIFTVFFYAMISVRYIGPFEVHIGAGTWNLFGTMRFGAWSGFIIGTIRLGVRIALLVVALRLLLHMARRLGSGGISTWIGRENRRCCKDSVPWPHYRDARDKLRSVLRISAILTTVSAVLLSLWFVFVEFGYKLSNGNDPHDYTVITQNPGSTSNSYSASLIDVDPDPFYAFLGLMIVSGIGGWLLKIGGEQFLLVVRGVTDQRSESLKSEYQARRLAASLSDRKIYRDAKFANVEKTLTGVFFNLRCHRACALDKTP